MRRGKMPAFQTPRPTPKFFTEPQTFSTKKLKHTRDFLPPRPPMKSAPPISRVFPHRPITRAQIVSFRSSITNDSILSQGYNQNSKDLYFNQCFQIISLLGTGSFGEVFKVKSKEDGKMYAVKKSKDRFRGESDRRRKLEEVAKQEKLPRHPNCVRIYKAWEERQHLYLLVELCKMSLTNYSETHHDIPENQIWNFLVNLLQAVKHLHDNNLVHMDIKPDNIFISYDNICKLGDFGLVIDLSRGNDFSEAQEGDPKYLAPELMDGMFGKPADIFSLGMTILELASDLDLPRCGDGWHILRQGQLPDEFLRDKSFDLKYVIRQMLHPDPRSRPTADQCLAFPCVVKKLRHLQKKEKLTHSSGCSSSDASALDNSILDDELFCHDNGIDNNLMGSLLASFSSENSFHGDAFKPPVRTAFSTPALRSRHYSHIPSPISSSPVVRLPSRSGSVLTTSPIHQHHEGSDQTWVEGDRLVTPMYNLNPEDVVRNKSTIEPRNLLWMFDAACNDNSTP